MKESRNLKTMAEIFAPESYDEILQLCVSEALKGNVIFTLFRNKPLPKKTFDRLIKEGFTVSHSSTSMVPHKFEIGWAL